MAVIRKIRSYSGLLIAVIGFALAAFVLGDLLGYGPMVSTSTTIGEVEDNEISYQEFERRVEESIDNYKAQTGNPDIGQRESFQIRQETWNQMMREILLDEQLEKLGIEVTSQELSDMIYGSDPHPWIVSSFSDPQTGEYDPQQVINFLNNFEMLDAGTRNQWMMLEQYIKRERKENKYYNLIREGYYVPQVLAQMDYKDRNQTADASFISVPYTSIADSLVSVSDAELREIYEQNKQDYEREETRALEYVAFPVFPTEEDRESLRRELLDLQPELKSTENIQGFINSVSDTRFDPSYLSRNEVSPEIEEAMFESEPGTIYGPYVENNQFVLAKLNDVQMRPDSMQASHILISYVGSRGASAQVARTEERARELADSLLTVARRNPGRFSALAEEFSDDPSAAMNQGDLGWFQDGAMVPGFNEAVINNSVGNFTVAESQFGYHVIRVTGKSPATRKVQIAKLTRDIEPSSRTYQMVYASASEFASTLRETDSFEESVSQQGLSKRVVEEIKPMDSNIPGIENPRAIIQWAFSDNTEEGDFSRIFEVEDRFIVATVTEVNEEGIPSLEEIRDEIMEIAIRDKKFEQISENMRNAMDNGNIEAIASELDTDVKQASNVTFNMRNLSGAGFEPKVTGTIFALEENTLSEPIKGNNGVFIVEVTNIEEVEIPEDLEPNKKQWQATFTNRVQNEVFRALRNNADIEDNRYRFY